MYQSCVIKYFQASSILISILIAYTKIMHYSEGFIDDYSMTSNG